MYKIIREFHFSYGHRILNHPGKCGRLHGHNARVEVELASKKLNRMKMVVDFYEVKKILGAWIDAVLDHRTLLWKSDPLVRPLQKEGEEPVLLAEAPTAEVLAKLIFEEARRRGLPVSRVTVWETPNSAASYEK